DPLRELVADLVELLAELLEIGAGVGELFDLLPRLVHRTVERVVDRPQANESDLVSHEAQPHSKIRQYKPSCSPCFSWCARAARSRAKHALHATGSASHAFAR